MCEHAVQRSKAEQNNFQWKQCGTMNAVKGPGRAGVVLQGPGMDISNLSKAVRQRGEGRGRGMLGECTWSRTGLSPPQAAGNPALNTKREIRARQKDSSWCIMQALDGFGGRAVALRALN